jgi:hypothetical protein
MHFVTTKRPGYAMFCMTPSERAAIGVTDDQQRLHVLERHGSTWKVAYDWPVVARSHTEMMTRLGDVAEPATVADLVRLAGGVPVP